MEKSNQNLSSPFGYHLSLDLYGCNPDKIRNIENGYAFLSSIPDLIETDIQSPPFVVHKKNIGFAGWIPVVESGISIYAYFPKNFASIDVYTCKKFNKERVKDFALETFSPTRSEEDYMLRGTYYTPPVELISLKNSLNKRN
ncbi:MAG: hypothetical protein GF370_03080 [Candidatus Nealsonbacteria bacterium]|nr:hypothetical protein [Candidatus Nealsonbacteria bacterium]